MTFEYIWKNKEANFGRPLRKQVSGGTHITLEIIPKYHGRYFAFRRSSIPEHEAPQKSKKQKLYFCHNLIRYGESFDKCIKRIVKSQTGCTVKSYHIIDIESGVQKKDNQWAITPIIVAELKDEPQPGKYGNAISEVVSFTNNTIPTDFAWWTKNDLKEILNATK